MAGTTTSRFLRKSGDDEGNKKGREASYVEMSSPFGVALYSNPIKDFEYSEYLEVFLDRGGLVDGGDRLVTSPVMSPP